MQKHVIINVAGNGINDVIIVDSIGLDFFWVVGNLGWWDRGVFKAKRHKTSISVITTANMIVLVIESISSQIII